ncbi:RecQ family ATP-dependent DNA helicase [Brevibacterium luteolum]|uniref:DNA 3'-5' helicase n=1 Tax=Brevibacterium luteolum TaxID=199591 RepID=A0A849AUF4_9MICO|nr:RecQ family ATP-dependent DNA helicase [Brevibacterium luteolum]MBM7529511.1 ATP-dependent DNA helicase RecQ [Brevibacterium luteolum]NNG79520.1 ATP-dependent DNA helicase RecQ [Brevibacterium luteolum]
MSTDASAPQPATASAAASDPQLHAAALEVLRELTGRADAQFHPGQFEAIAALVAQHRRALVVQRTGWGKSAVYFVAATLLRRAGCGPSLIISPLLALMRDQVAAAERAGVRAVTMNSSNAEAWDQVRADLAAGAVDVLLISPERLANPSFRSEVLPGLMADLGMIVIDEAHCISDWGHDFRPDYRRIGSILAELPGSIPVLATTATANSRVVDDVAEQLGHDALVIRGQLARDSLRLGVMAKSEPARRLAWLCEHLGDFTGSGIIYTLTVAAAQDAARALTQAGWNVAAYTGASDADERAAMEAALKANEVKALVATSALGMGFDKPDLGFVIHFGAPSSPVAYYQQVGRAGRATESADVLLMPGPEDERIWEYFATASMPDEETAAAVLASLSAEEPMSIPALETVVGEKRARLELLLKILQVDGAVDRVRGGFVTTGAGWTYDAQRYAAVAATRAREADAMREYERTQMCRMRYLTGQLDDDTTGDCGRCDNCVGPWFSTEVSDSGLQTAGSQLAGVGLPVAPRAQWPTGLDRLGIELRGKIASAERCAEGRVIARLTDLGIGQRLAETFSTGQTDAPVPEAIGQAAVKVLADWDWQSRPEVVISVPNTLRPVFTRSLAAGLASVGQMQDIGEFELLRDPGSPDVNSAFRVRNLAGAFRLTDEQAAAVNGKTVLLVDALIVSRWTMTVLARQLLQAGAAAVLPFAAAQQA